MIEEKKVLTNIKSKVAHFSQKIMLARKVDKRPFLFYTHMHDTTVIGACSFITQITFPKQPSPQVFSKTHPLHKYYS